MSGTNRLLLIEDDPDFSALVAVVARELRFEFGQVDVPRRWLDTYRAFSPDVIVLDLMMPEVDGVQVLRRLADEGCKASILLVSGADPRVLATVGRVARERALRICELVRKPVTPDRLAVILGRYFEASPTVTEQELREAIAEQRIGVHFQPKVNLRTGGAWVVDCVEALARLQHPQRGPVPAKHFIAVAETAGLMEELTRMVLEEAFATLATLRHSGFRIDLAFNLSAPQLCDDRLGETIAEAARRHGLESERLIVEITESATLADHARMMESLARLRLKGVRLSLDDFGTGYSSLLQLYRMPFTELKIDQAFVRDVEWSKDSQVMVRSVVELAHNLGLTCCAEGVQSAEAIAFLRAAGCDRAQGYFISEPLAADRLTRFLADNLYERGRTVARARWIA